MKVMPLQKISAVAATSEDANYPASNVMNEHPKMQWNAAAGVSVATLTLTIDSMNSGLAVFETNANTINITVSDPNNITWETGVSWEAGVSFATFNATVTELLSLDGVSGSAWFEWPYSDTGVTAVLIMSSPLGGTLKVGVAVADKVYTYTDPQYGVKEGMKSYSIIKELQNGAFYRKERDKVRTFLFSIIEDRAIDFYEFMYTVARNLGYKPAAWQLTNQDGFWWVIYARFQSMPAARHSMPNHSIISTKLIEVL